MKEYYLVEHEDWEAPKKIYSGPNTNAAIFDLGYIRTIGSSPECHWTIPDPALPDIVAFLAYHRYRRNYICELNPEDYGSQEQADFLKRKPVLHKVITSFQVAGYHFVSRHIEPAESDKDAKFVRPFDRIRAAYIKTWDGHMSPGDYEGYARDLAAHTAWKNGEDIYEVIRKQKEGLL